MKNILRYQIKVNALEKESSKLVHFFPSYCERKKNIKAVVMLSAATRCQERSN